MTIARIKNETLLFIALSFGFAIVVTSSCKSSVRALAADPAVIDSAVYTKSRYYIDVTGNSSLDTLMICNNEINPAIRDIYLHKGEANEKIVSIRPWRDSTFVLTEPPIEIVYLEANNIQTGDRGFRVIIRNTDVAPDCMFIDIYNDDTQWVVGRYYLLNTLSDFGRDLFIKSVEIERPLKEVFGEELMCDPVDDIDAVYFGFPWD
jgi:hypothetical protein